jgi:hypothetical protein
MNGLLGAILGPEAADWISGYVVEGFEWLERLPTIALFIFERRRSVMDRTEIMIRMV